MFINYIKIAGRNIFRNKLATAINILGLSIGLGTCLIIMLFVHNEMSYDRFNEKYERIARVYFEGNIQGEKMKEPHVMGPLAQTMKNDFPEVEDATRLRLHYQDWRPKFLVNNVEFREDVLAYADSNFFEIFTLPFIAGDSRTALTQPNTVILTEEVAEKYFGKSITQYREVIGETINFKSDEKHPLKVTGVIENIPINSHFQFGLLASIPSLQDPEELSWMNSNYYTYVVLNDKKDFEKLEAKIPGLVDKYMGPLFKAGLGQTLDEFRQSGSNITFHMQKLSDIHLYSDFQNDLSKPGDVRTVYIFSAIALFMLLIACINFMNLSTAGASKRSREVGVRKVLGSMKSDLVKQFLVESTMISAMAMLLSLYFVKMALPFFNQLSGLELQFSIVNNPFLILALAVIILITGLIAGSYPAFYLSSFKPVAVLKGKWNPAKSGISFRSALVVFQFFISIILIVSTTVVYKQLAYMNNKDIGYNKDQVLILSNLWTLGNNMDAFKEHLRGNPEIAIVSASRFLPAGNDNDNNFFVSDIQNPDKLVKTLRYEIDEQYIPALDIQLKQGRNFSREFTTDSSSVILNEAAAKAFGWKEDVVGQTISRAYKEEEGKELFRVIGVVKDFHFRSLHEHITPMVMVLKPDPGNLIVKLSSNDIPGLAARLEKQFMSYGAEDPLVYSFLDERYSNYYKIEQKTGTILGLFAGLTIFIACLGLFGLAKFTAEQRIKEIGIRKVLGATILQLSAMLSRDFIKLVLIACCIAFPLAWWTMNKWLEEFAYRTGLSWWIFLAAGMIAILIALSTISYQAIKAAISNPVKSLRTE